MTNPHTPIAAALIASHIQQAATDTYTQTDDAVFFARATYIDAPVRPRILLEREIVRRAATALTQGGYELRVHDGEAWATSWTDSVDVVMGAIMATDEDVIYVRDLTSNGGINLIYGNDGWDVIADHTVNLGDVLQDTNDFADAVAEVL